MACRRARPMGPTEDHPRFAYREGKGWIVVRKPGPRGASPHGTDTVQDEHEGWSEHYMGRTLSRILQEMTSVEEGSNMHAADRATLELLWKLIGRARWQAIHEAAIDPKILRRCDELLRIVRKSALETSLK